MAKILFVDDYYESREIYMDLLKKAGHEVETAGDGETAKNLILMEKFDLVLLDLLLPKKDSIQILEEIGNTNIKTPRNKIFVMSVLGQEDIVKKALEKNIGGNILKSNLSQDEVLKTILSKL